MEDGLGRLLARVEKLEKEIAEIRRFVGMPQAPESKGPLSGEESDLMAALSKMAPKTGQRVKIADLRKALGMDAKEFDNALSSLAREGRVSLHETGAFSLSIRGMGESFMGENGELYTEVSMNFK